MSLGNFIILKHYTAIVLLAAVCVPKSSWIVFECGLSIHFGDRCGFIFSIHFGDRFGIRL